MKACEVNRNYSSIRLAFVTVKPKYSSVNSTMWIRTDGRLWIISGNVVMPQAINLWTSMVNTFNVSAKVTIWVIVFERKEKNVVFFSADRKSFITKLNWSVTEEMTGFQFECLSYGMTWRWGMSKRHPQFCRRNATFSVNFYIFLWDYEIEPMRFPAPRLIHSASKFTYNAMF